MFLKIKDHLTSSHLFRRFSSGVFWTFIGNISWRLLSVISTVVVARILGPKGFGEFGMIQSTIEVFAVYAGCRLGTTSTKYVAEYREKDPVRAGRILKMTLTLSFILCSTVALTLYASSGYLADTVLDRPSLETGLAIGAFLIFFLVYGEVKQYALAGFESFKAIAIVNALRGAATPLICIPLTYYWGVEGTIAGLGLVAMIMLTTNSIFLRREQIKAGFPKEISFAEIKGVTSVLWKYALPGLLVGILISLMVWLGRYILVHQESGYSELGIFVAANQWRALIIFLPAILVRVVLPILAETYSNKNDKSEFQKAISIQVQTVCLITLPLVILVISSSELLAAVFGKDFESSQFVIPILMLWVFLDAMNQTIRQIYDGAGKRWANLAMYMVWAILFISGCYTFIPQYGVIGLALAHFLAEGVLLLIQAIYVDFVLAPGALRRHLQLFTYAAILLAITYHIKTDFPESWWAIPTLSGLFVLGLLPILLKLKAIKT